MLGLSVKSHAPLVVFPDVNVKELLLVLLSLASHCSRARCNARRSMQPRFAASGLRWAIDRGKQGRREDIPP